MTNLSNNDREATGRSRPPVWLVAAIVVVVTVVVVLHLTGVVGPGA
jgi:hypothetical protein